MSDPDWRSGLLVSVRNASEADEAATAGAAIVDVKEPDRGPLGAADPAVTAAIVATVSNRAAVTLACGELAAGVDAIVTHVDAVLRRLPASARPPVAIKVGPGGLDLAAWRGRFARLVTLLPPGLEAVAVAYADCLAAASPAPEAIMAGAAGAGVSTLLVDTFDKAGPGLFDTVDRHRIRRWVADAAAAGLTLAVAGRLSPAGVADGFALGADVCGVRTAACEGGRLGRVSGPLVERLVTLAIHRPRRCTSVSRRRS